MTRRPDDLEILPSTKKTLCPLPGRSLPFRINLLERKIKLGVAGLVTQSWKQRFNPGRELGEAPSLPSGRGKLSTHNLSQRAVGWVWTVKTLSLQLARVNYSEFLKAISIHSIRIRASLQYKIMYTHWANLCLRFRCRPSVHVRPQIYKSEKQPEKLSF